VTPPLLTAMRGARWPDTGRGRSLAFYGQPSRGASGLPGQRGDGETCNCCSRQLEMIQLRLDRRRSVRQLL